MELFFIVIFCVMCLVAILESDRKARRNTIELWVLVDIAGRIHYTGSEDDVRTIRLNYKNKDELYAVLLTGNINAR